MISFMSETIIEYNVLEAPCIWCGLMLKFPIGALLMRVKCWPVILIFAV